MKRVLIVEPNPTAAAELARGINSLADITVASCFSDAREILMREAPDLLVANLRLERYNALHLVHLASADADIHAIVYTDRAEIAVVKEIRAAGAFYEESERIARVLPDYLLADLPVRDRRAFEPARVGSGRRTIDVSA
jgi:ActR/RegA family two-component response regulator